MSEDQGMEAKGSMDEMGKCKRLEEVWSKYGGVQEIVESLRRVRKR